MQSENLPFHQDTFPMLSGNLGEGHIRIFSKNSRIFTEVFTEASTATFTEVSSCFFLGVKDSLRRI
jgi:hypothetical protein